MKMCGRKLIVKNHGTTFMENSAVRYQIKPIDIILSQIVDISCEIKTINAFESLRMPVFIFIMIFNQLMKESFQLGYELQLAL